MKPLVRVYDLNCRFFCILNCFVPVYLVSFSACILEFDDVDTGDQMYKDVHRSVASGDDVIVEHPDFHTDPSFWTNRTETGVGEPRARRRANVELASS